MSQYRLGQSRGPVPAVVVVSALLLILQVGGGALGWWPLALDLESLTFLAIMVLFLALGPLILWKVGNRIGWVFTGIGLCLLGASWSVAFIDQGVAVFGAIGGAFWLSWILGIGILVLWFPTGHVPNRRWMWLQRLGFALLGVTFFTYMFTHRLCRESAGNDCVNWIDNPIGIPGVPNPEYGGLGGVLFALYLFFMLAALASLFLRLRRASPVERLQIKWLLLACASVVSAILTEQVLGAFGLEPLWNAIWIVLSFVAVPVATAVAVLRYRLYDIDRIVSRTVSYALVVGLLAAVFFGAVALLTSWLPAESDLAVAGSTLAVAALFNPLRRRVQIGVDRRFNRARYDAEQVMDRFSVSLRDTVAAGEIVEGWVGVVAATMKPASLAVWTREPG